MLSHHYLDHAYLLKTNQNFRQTIHLFLVKPRRTLKFVIWLLRKKRKLDLRVIHRNITYMFTVVKVTKAKEHGMTKISTRSEFIWCKLRYFFVKVLLFWVVDEPLIIFTDSFFSLFFYWIFQRIRFETFWLIKKDVQMLYISKFQEKSIINSAITILIDILLY